MIMPDMFTAFAIRTCSLLTNAKTRFQSMDLNRAGLLKGASVDLLTAVICSPCCENSTNYLATEHLSDVSPLSGRANLEPVSAPLQDGIRFFRPLTPAPPTGCLAVSPDGRFWRRYGVSTFHEFAD